MEDAQPSHVLALVARHRYVLGFIEQLSVLRLGDVDRHAV